MENFTVADLLRIRKAQPRSARRRRGLTEFRDDPVLDSCLHKKKEVNHKESGQSHLKMEHPVSRVLESNPNGESPVSSRSRPINSEKKHISRKKSTTMMIKGSKKQEEAPLHDMNCIGVDTCSARSISCRKEDFLDLDIVQDTDDHLRGIGGHKGVAGKGCLVFYVKDSEGKMKAILEPKGFYLENPPAQFRIIGQQRMKHKDCAQHRITTMQGQTS